MPLESLTLARGVPLTRQIADHVREQIRNGALGKGEMLPPAAELADVWGTDAATVHRALATLAKEGLLDRKPRVGTFVRDARPVLDTVGVYLGASVLQGRSPFRQALAEALRTELERVGFGVQFFIDPRDEAVADTPLPQLAHAVEHHQIQALVMPGTNPHLTAWVRRLKVPLVALSRGPEHTLDIDHQLFLELAVGALADQGCGSVGLICPSPGTHFDMRAMLVDAACNRNLQLRDEWVLCAECGHRQPPHPPHQSVGYDAMRKVLSSSALPEGLVIYPDSIAAGAILALVESGIAIPQRLRLVLHRNRGLPLLCPFPATYVESDPAEVAAMLVQQARELHAGKPVKRTRVRHYLVEE